jgi:hypothetical protein
VFYEYLLGSANCSIAMNWTIDGVSFNEIRFSDQSLLDNLDHKPPIFIDAQN